MSKKVSVVISHLKDHNPVIKEVKVIPDSVDDPVHFGETHCNEVEQRFCNDYIEFNHARWYFQILDLIE